MSDDTDSVIDLTGTSDHENEAIDDVSVTQLHIAIATVPEIRLREVVAKLVDEDRTIQRAVFAQLVTATRQTRAVVPRYEICANCGDEFDVSDDREEDECTYHPGSLKVDYAMFIDWDEDCHGPEDTPANREEFPENFKWSCCRKDGRRRGCHQSEHIAQRKKRRV